jgi:protocatechuate 3,4-dioxygenase beta subunit
VLNFISVVNNGESIASEGKGEYMYVEGRVLDTKGKPVPNATIETWETDDNGAFFLTFSMHIQMPIHTCMNVGFYDTQYSERDHPDCRGRLRSDSEGRYGYRAVVPVAYPIPGDVRNLS